MPLTNIIGVSVCTIAVIVLIYIVIKGSKQDATE